MPAPAIERIMAELIRLDVPAGEVLVREGDEGDRFSVIVEGPFLAAVTGHPRSRESAESVATERMPGAG